MVRKAKGASQATYCALLDAAERQFFEKGVTRTTLSDVAQAAGLTRGAIYWHFEDKAALLQAMCDRVFLPMQSLLHEMAATSTTHRDPIDGVRQMMLHMLGQVACNVQQQTVFGIVFHHCEKNDDMRFIMGEREKRAECLAKLEKIVGQCIAKKKLPAQTDPFLSAQAINGYLIGLLYEWLLDPQAYDLGKHALQLVDTFLAGLIANPPLKKAAGDI